MLEATSLIPLVEQGLSSYKIADALGCSQGHVHRSLKHHGLSTTVRPGPAPKFLCLREGCDKNCRRHKSKENMKFCSHSCKKQHYVLLWESGKWDGCAGNSVTLSKIVRNRLFELHNNSCEECGWSKSHPVNGKIPLQVHHVDGTGDHSPSNLKLLCPNCHSLTENYGSMNKTARPRQHAR